METIEQRFGRRLRRVRKEWAKETRVQLALGVGTDRVTIYRWETGKSAPNGRQLLLLLRRYREWTDYLVNGETGEEPASLAHETSLTEFLASPLGKAIEAANLTQALMAIPYKNPPSVATYRAIALALLGDTGGE